MLVASCNQRVTSRGIGSTAAEICSWPLTVLMHALSLLLLLPMKAGLSGTALPMRQRQQQMRPQSNGSPSCCRQQISAYAVWLPGWQLRRPHSLTKQHSSWLWGA